MHVCSRNEAMQVVLSLTKEHSGRWWIPLVAAGKSSFNFDCHILAPRFLLDGLLSSKIVITRQFGYFEETAVCFLGRRAAAWETIGV